MLLGPKTNTTGLYNYIDNNGIVLWSEGGCGWPVEQEVNSRGRYLRVQSKVSVVTGRGK